MPARSQINITKTLISQALIDLEIGHEEYKAIINEEEHYRRLKENIRTMRSSDELNGKEDQKNESNKTFREGNWNFFLTNAKIFKISVETDQKNYIHTIKVHEKDGRTVLWIKMHDIQRQTRC